MNTHVNRANAFRQMPIAHGCGAAIIRNNEILLLKRLSEPDLGLWGLPGGKVSSSENTLDAIQRELFEELGIKAYVDSLLCTKEHDDPQCNCRWVSDIFLVKNYDGSAFNKEPHKHQSICWFSLQCIPGDITGYAIAALQAWNACARH